MTVERPPDHVLAAFGLSGVRPVPLGVELGGRLAVRRSRAVDGRRPRPRRLVGEGSRDVVRRRCAAGPAGPLDRRPLRGGGLARRHLRRRHARAAPRRGGLGRGAAARGDGQAGAAPIPDPAAGRAVGRRRRLHRRRPRRVGGAAAAVAAAGGAGVAGLGGRAAVGRADQPARRAAPTDEEPQPAGARRSLRHSAFRGHRGAGHHRHHARTGGPRRGRRAWSSSTRCRGARPTMA